MLFQEMIVDEASIVATMPRVQVQPLSDSDYLAHKDKQASTFFHVGTSWNKANYLFTNINLTLTVGEDSLLYSTANPAVDLW